VVHQRNVYGTHEKSKDDYHGHDLRNFGVTKSVTLIVEP
jgi:hypothetical protein